MKLSDGREVDHDIQNPEIVKILSDLLEKRHLRTERIRLWYGEDGSAWPEEYDVTGYLSCSSGIKPCIILVNNRKSLGGGAILADRIVRIDSTKGVTLYKHPKFETNLELMGKEIHHKGKVIARFDDSNQAQKLFNFLEGLNYKK